MDTRRHLLSLVAGLIAQVASISAALPPDRTGSYTADLIGHDNGSLTVKETFEITTTGAETNRTPARYLQEDFADGPSIGIRVKRILRDGQPVEFDTEKENEFLIIYFGRRDEPLPPGTYRFQAEYELDQFTAEAGGRTSLMWKSVPACWPMQIDRVRVHLQLPPSILSGVVEFYGFTGLEESGEADLKITRDANNGATFVNLHPVCKDERFDVIAAWATPFAGDERILRFTSDVVLNADGSADVRECITARVLGQSIRHGIERYLLRRDRGPLGTWQYPSYVIHEASLDGRSVPFDESVDPSGDFLVLRIGEKNETVGNGEHTFTLGYHTRDQFLHRTGGDQFYWNVTGTGPLNEFPVDQVTASITLPSGIQPTNIAWQAWAGRPGETNGLFDVWFDPQGRLTFLAHDFARDEAFTLQLDLPEGSVPRPTGVHRVWLFIRDNGQLVPACGGLLAMAIFLAVAWIRYGRDPAKGIIIPIYDPPDQLSPAQVRHVMRMGYDERCFSSDVLDLAARGLVAIGIDGNRYRLKRTSHLATGLPADEEAALARLFTPDGKDVEVGESGYRALAGAREAIRAAVDRTCDVYFFENGTYAGYGLMISFFSLLAAVFFAPAGHKAMGLLWTVLMIPGTLLAVWLAFVAFRKWAHVLRGRVPLRRGIGLALLATLLVAGAGWLEWWLIGQTSADTSLPMALVIAGTVFLNYVSWDILRAPSVQGRKLMDRIEGFRMYLETGEKEILEYATKIGADTSRMPVRTVDLYEKHLPYALALDVENKWAGKFADLLDGVHGHPAEGVTSGMLAMSCALDVLSQGGPSLHQALEQPVSLDVHKTSTGSGRTAWSVASLVAGAVVGGFAGGGRGGGGVGGW